MALPLFYESFHPTNINTTAALSVQAASQLNNIDGAAAVYGLMRAALSIYDLG